MNRSEEVKLNAVEYFGDELTANVWFDKYCLKDIKNNKIIDVTPDHTIIRLACEIHRIEKVYPNPVDYKDIYRLMSVYKRFVLGGSPLFGIGNNTTLSTLGNCFVVDSPYDSYGGILKTDQELAQLMKRRGGVGVDLSTIRAKDTIVNNAANTSTGIIPFMERYSNTTREVAQEGRRGALMLTIDAYHDEAMAFVESKDDTGKITGANISVKVSDAFMHQLTISSEYEVKLWSKIIHQAWKNAEPGVLFWDKIIKESPADCYPDFKTISTNPCGELPLCAYDSCRLSAINAYEYVINPFTSNATFDWDSLARDSQLAQRIMDNVVDLEAEKIIAIIHKIFSDPEPTEVKAIELDLWDKIYQKLVTGRRTGLGQMGIADAGAAMGYKYGSKEFNEWAEEVSKTISLNSYISSIIMAEERGHFTAYDRSLELDNPFIQRILTNLPPEYVDKYFKYGRRNIANLTIAPTGSISMLAGVTSGIEPVFALSYKRKRKVPDNNPWKTFRDKQGDWWEEYNILHPKFKTYCLLDYRVIDELDLKLDDNIKPLAEISPYYKATAHEIDVHSKIDLQSGIQQWIDHSISVTYNLPKNISETEVSKLYLEAWEKGLKGMTIYRDGSREGILTTHTDEHFIQHDAPKRPKVLPHEVYSIMSKGHHWMVSIGMLEDKPYEVFAFNNVEISGSKFIGEMIKLAKGRYDLYIPSETRTFQNITNGCSDEENLLTRMISTSLRHGANIRFIVEQLNKSTGDITSFGRAIGRILNKYVPDTAKPSILCPECKAIMSYEGGCLICKTCGYSKCG